MKFMKNHTSSPNVVFSQKKVYPVYSIGHGYIDIGDVRIPVPNHLQQVVGFVVGDD